MLFDAENPVVCVVSNVEVLMKEALCPLTLAVGDRGPLLETAPLIDEEVGELMAGVGPGAGDPVVCAVVSNSEVLLNGALCPLALVPLWREERTGDADAEVLLTDPLGGPVTPLELLPLIREETWDWLAVGAPERCALLNYMLSILICPQVIESQRAHG